MHQQIATSCNPKCVLPGTYFAIIRMINDHALCMYISPDALIVDDGIDQYYEEMMYQVTQLKMFSAKSRKVDTFHGIKKFYRK